MQYGSTNKGNVFTGFIGALIGAVVGIAAWVLIGKLGYISSLAALVAALVSSKLYDVFGGKQGAAKVVILILCVLITVGVGSVGTYFWLSNDLYNEELEEVVALFEDYGYSEAEARTEAEILMDETYGGRMGHFEELMSYEENQELLRKDLLTGLVFAALGCVGVIFGGAKARSKRKPGVEADAE